jgi:hypothetical protein
VSGPARLAFAAAACLAGSPAAAGPPPGRPYDVIDPVPVSREEVAESDRLFRRTVACLVEFVPARARALLETDPGSRVEDRFVDSFHTQLQRCDRLRNRRRGTIFYSTLMRGVIAEILYHQQFPHGIGGLALPDPEQAAAWTRPRAPTENQYLALLHGVARCVVLRQPALVDAVLGTPPLSAEENRAMRSIRTEIAACIDATMTFTTNAQSLRSLLAEAALGYGEARRSR